MEALASGDDDRVIAYDGAGLSATGRAWWMLRLFGHDDVALLDGGSAQMDGRGAAVDTAVPGRPAAVLRRVSTPRSYERRGRCSTNLSTRREQVVDARASGRFDGSAEETRPGLRRGHIPGSRNLPYDQVTDPQTRQLRSAERASPAVPRRWSGAGPTDRDELRLRRDRVCRSLCLHLIGHPGAAVMTDRGQNGGCSGDTPVEAGPAPAKAS